MKYHNSEMVLERFIILNFQFAFIQGENPSNKEIVPKEIFEDLNISIDFGITESTKNNIFKIITKIEIKPKKNKLGYKILAEGLGQFRTDKVNDLKDLKGLKNSALAININKLRETIYYSTIEAPLGSIQLPLVDLSKLVKDKLIIQKKKADKEKKSNSTDTKKNKTKKTTKKK